MKRSLLIAATALLLAPASPLAGMQVAPVLVEIDAATPSAVVTVRNEGGETMRYQVSASAWSESATGETRLEPSTELAAFPGLFQLGPGQSRKIRVGATVAPAAIERAWRLFIEELPPPADASRSRVRLRTRFAIPVFQAPVRPQPSAKVALRYAGGALGAVVENTGNVHLKPEAMAVTLLGANGERLHDAQLRSTVVLARSERVVNVPVPPEICASGRSARMVVVLPNEKLEATLALPGGACAP